MWAGKLKTRTERSCGRSPQKPDGNVGVDPGVLEATREGMRRVTNEGGTAEYSFKGGELAFVGKSGTGEMWGNDPINWFAGWAENQGEPLVVVAAIEGGGLHSDITAAPAVRHTLEAYYGVPQSAKDRWFTAPRRRARRRARERRDPSWQRAKRRVPGNPRRGQLILRRIANSG